MSRLICLMACLMLTNINRETLAKSRSPLLTGNTADTVRGMFSVSNLSEDPHAGGSMDSLQEEVDPLPGADFTWVQGSNRQKGALLKGRYFTGGITLDANYNLHFNRPIDHSNSGSTATFRSNEFNISYIEAGGEINEPKSGARAKLMLQFGSRASGIPKNDLSPLRGQYDLYKAMQYVTEAYAGIHLKKWKGINIDFGLFKSYVGLLSYNNFENWNYQPSFTSDNTPWFFTGARMQVYPGHTLKLELWLINGWQSYAMFNEAPGAGFQIQWRPREWASVLSSSYVGWDTPDNKRRMRFHTDHSAIIRYRNQPSSKFISKAAFSLTADLGFENGGGVVPFDGTEAKPAQYFLSWMFYHRCWLGPAQQWAFTFGGGYIKNPGRYLTLLPGGNAIFTQQPGDPFEAWDASAGLQFMPNEYVTFGAEFVSRHANVPYFTGRGGLTSSNGWNPPIGNPSGYKADLVKEENRIIFSTIFRF